MKSADYCSPKDIENSNELFAVEESLRAANEKEINYANQKDTPLQKQEEVTNKALEDIRISTREDIQTFEQLDEYLIKNPGCDLEVTKIVIDSGYLNLWEIDIQKNPWHYDFEAFKNHYPEIQYAYMGKWLISFCKEIFSRFTGMHQYYEEKLLMTKIEYFQVMHELYAKLLRLNNQRMEVGIDALIAAGLSEEEIVAVGQI